MRNDIAVLWLLSKQGIITALAKFIISIAELATSDSGVCEFGGKYVTTKKAIVIYPSFCD